MSGKKYSVEVNEIGVAENNAVLAADNGTEKVEVNPPNAENIQPNRSSLLENDSVEDSGKISQSDLERNPVDGGGKRKNAAQQLQQFFKNQLLKQKNKNKRGGKSQKQNKRKQKNKSSKQQRGGKQSRRQQQQRNKNKKSRRQQKKN